MVICVVQLRAQYLDDLAREGPLTVAAAPCEINPFLSQAALRNGDPISVLTQMVDGYCACTTVWLHGHHLDLSIMSAASERPTERWSLTVNPILGDTSGQNDAFAWTLVGLSHWWKLGFSSLSLGAAQLPPTHMLFPP
jgi:hypothetical protein